MTDASLPPWPQITVNAVLDHYVADRHNPHAERRCKHPYSIEAHLKAVRAAWGEMLLQDFATGSKARVKTQVAAWKESGTAQSTCRKRISLLRTGFRLAVDDELINRAHEPVFKLPANGPPRERFLDDERELPALLAAADEMDTPWHTRGAVEIALRTGQRMGAIRDLCWANVDFERREIRFRDTEAIADRSKKRRGIKAMDDDLYRLMQWLYARRSDECDNVIHWRDKPCKSLYVGIKALYKRAGITDLRCHDLRKASATYVDISLGGNLAQAASHIDDTEATAKRHYVQPNARASLPAIAAVSDVLAKARKSAA